MPHSEIRLALFSDTWSPQLNGVARTLARVVDAVNQRGGAVRIYTTTDPHATATDDVVRYPSMPFPLYGQLRLAAPSPSSIARDLREFQPTVAHIATPFGVGVAARAAARRLSIPLVTSYHTSFCAYAEHYQLGWLNAPGWRFLRWFHNGGLRTLCPTRAVIDDLGARGFERLGLWGRGVDCEAFHPRRRSRVTRMRFGANDGTTVVAYVGRMAKEKGIDDMIAAARRARRSRTRIIFAFAGDGPYLDACVRRAPDNCVFTGRIEGEELAQFYASADLFVFPSITDTFGNVLLEAMASGLPVLAADTPAAREVVGGAGEFYEGRNAEALSRGIDAVIDTLGKRSLLATASRRRAAQFSWDRALDELMGTYASATSQARDGSAEQHTIRLDRSAKRRIRRGGAFEV